MPPFKLEAPFTPKGDQGQAIEKLTAGWTKQDQPTPNPSGPPRTAKGAEKVVTDPTAAQTREGANP